MESQFKTRLNLNEYLSKDILEDDFLKAFSSYRFLQLLFGSCRVDARNRFVTAPSVKQRLYTIVCIIAVIAIYLISGFSFWIEFSYHIIIFILCVFALSVNFATYVCNIIHVRFHNRDANVKFFIKMQQTDRIMGIENNKAVNVILQKLNNVTVLVTIAIYIAFSLLILTGGLLISLQYIGIIWCYGVFVIELSHCCSLMIYFYVRIKFLNAIIANHIKPINKNTVNDKFILSKSYIRWHVSHTHNFISSETDTYLKEILDCFSLFQELYKFQILLFFLNYFTLLVVTFESGIQSMLLRIDFKSQIWACLISIEFSLNIIAANLCICCEVFYREVKETKRLCVAIMSRYYEGPLRQKAKNMLTLIEETPPRFSVYDMWQLDARLMISVFTIITSFLVTLLQFALL